MPILWSLVTILEMFNKNIEIWVQHQATKELLFYTGHITTYVHINIVDSFITQPDTNVI